MSGNKDQCFGFLAQISFGPVFFNLISSCSSCILLNIIIFRPNRREKGIEGGGGGLIQQGNSSLNWTTSFSSSERNKTILFSLSLLTCSQGRLRSCSGLRRQKKCEVSSLCSTARNYTQQKVRRASFSDGDGAQSQGVEVNARKQKLLPLLLALPMQIFIAKAGDSIVTVLLALQWLSVHPCCQEIG